MPSASADWSLLERLFADEGVEFRHAMGLARSNTQDFYAPSAAARSILTQKGLF